MNAFAAAHALTRTTIAAHPGSDYRATFAAALRIVYADRANAPRKLRIVSNDRMSNSGYHRSGKATWWARIGSGAGAEFLQVGRERADRVLDVVVEVPAGVTEIYIGAGKAGSRDAIRQTIRLAA